MLSGSLVFLRAPRTSDISPLIAAIRASQSFHRPWTYPPVTELQWRRFLARVASGGGRCFLVRPLGEPGVAGVVTLTEVIRGPLQQAFLGFYALVGFQGLGLMTEAVELATTYGFRRLHLHRIEANVQPANLASRRLLNRCGFEKEGLSRRYLKIGGRWRDHERWARLAEW